MASNLPSLYLVGDSMMKTGVGNGETGKWGWGAEIIPLFDASKITVHNEAHGGRSSRSYIEEGLWQKVLDQLKSGDYVMIHFGHNDAANSKDHPNRTTITGNGEQTIGVGIGQIAGGPPGVSQNVIHTYGWYLRQYIAQAKSKGATTLICSSAPRPQWTNGKIKRNLDGYAQWAAEAAQTGGAHFLDLNTIAANRYDAQGEKNCAPYFADAQHTTKQGARINAESVVQALRGLKNCPLVSALAAS